jgi:hypothetical protein
MTMPSINIETFTWQNLDADRYLGLHANAVRLYLDRVVKPALDAIDAQHAELATSDEPGAEFMQADVEDLRRSTVEAFALAIQSLWERQLREFLKGCAREKKRDDAFVASLATANWTRLVKSFGELRGLPMEAFDSFEDLGLLQLLGNACRHGDGESARLLYERWPDLWPMWPPALPELWSGPPLQNLPAHPLFAEISVPRALLDRLGHAVIWFWEDHNYVYTNSIQRKHESVARTLQGMREERARRPAQRSIKALRESC